MKNTFGQDINPGDIVGLGIRSGNSSEQRIGIVLEFIEEGKNWTGEMQYAARCAWYDPTSQFKYVAAEHQYKSVPRPGNVMISKQMFRFFKLDPQSIDGEMLRYLVEAYAKHG